MDPTQRDGFHVPYTQPPGRLPLTRFISHFGAVPLESRWENSDTGRRRDK